MIADDTKRKILKAYLGPFYGHVSEGEMEEFKRIYPTLKTTCVFCRKKIALLKTGCYFLLAYGKQNYRFLYTYNLIDFFLKTAVSGEEEDQTFYDTTSGLLILYHMANTMENRQLENLVCHTLSQRFIEKKPTLFLSECALPQVRNWFQLNECPIVDAIDQTTVSREGNTEL